MSENGTFLTESRPLIAVNQRAALLGGAAVLALLAGCDGSDKGASRFVDAEEAVAGDAIVGELTSASSINLKDGTRFESRWVCSAQGGDGQGDLYRLEAPFAADLSVFDSAGNWLGDARSSEGAPAQLLIAPTESCSLVVVSGRDKAAFGPYSLEPEPRQEPQEGAELASGQTLAGSLGDEVTTYPLSVDEATQVSLLLSGARDGILALSGEGVAAKAARCADDQQTLTAFLDPGDYEVSLTPGQPLKKTVDTDCLDGLVSVGSGYRLTLVQSDPSTGERNDGPLRDGYRITGTLEDASSSNRYTLVIEDGPTQVDLALSSSDFDTILGISGNQTDISVDDSGAGTDSRFDSLLMPGEYSVEVSGYGGESGAYSVELSTAPFDGELQNDGELPVGETIHGIASSGASNVYTLSLDDASEVVIDLSSSSFDTQLYVEGNGVSLNDDDGGNNTDSRLTTLLERGEYRVEVGSYSGSPSGMFSLSATATPFDGEVSNSGELAPGQTIRGALSAGGSNRYVFTLAQPAEVSLAMNSSAFDTLLELSGAEVSQRDDDGGGDTNSLINAVLAAGTYQVNASSYSGSGAFSLRFDAEPFNGAIQNSGEVRPGDTLYGQLSAGGTLIYRLVVEEAGTITLESQSAIVDTLMELGGPGVSLQDDDGGSTELGSMIETHLERGTYEVTISGYGGGGGVVRLDVRG